MDELQQAPIEAVAENGATKPRRGWLHQGARVLLLGAPRWEGLEAGPRTVACLVFAGYAVAFLQQFELAPTGLVANIVSFNVGVEMGQGLALAAILIGLTYWRTYGGFVRHACAANAVVMACGFLLVGYQVSGYFRPPK